MMYDEKNLSQVTDDQPALGNEIDEFAHVSKRSYEQSAKLSPREFTATSSREQTVS